MVAQLVRAGYARPGQTGWALIYSFRFDVVLDFAYAMVVESLTLEQRHEFDTNLANLTDLEDQERAEDQMVEKTLSDGRVIQISQARLNRLRRNSAAMNRVPRKGTEA